MESIRDINGELKIIDKGQVDEFEARKKLKDLVEWLDSFEYENDIITVANVRKKIK